MPNFFNDDYVRKAFYLWYNGGKLPAQILWNQLPDTAEGIKPTRITLERWIKNDFAPLAAELDVKVQTEIQARLIEEKISMFTRHAKVGKQMQEMAIEYLEEHRGELSSNNAIRLLVEGWRIERESVGLPTALEKMRDMSDDDLLEEVKQLMSSSQLVPLEDEKE